MVWSFDSSFSFPPVFTTIWKLKPINFQWTSLTLCLALFVEDCQLLPIVFHQELLTCPDGTCKQGQTITNTVWESSNMNKPRQIKMCSIRPPPPPQIFLLCCPHPTDRKMRKNRVRFFYLFFYRKCQIWAKNLLKFVFNGLKKHLYMYICVLTAFRPSFPYLETFFCCWKLNSLTVRKKKKKSTDRPNFQILCMWGQHKIFFLGPNRQHS